MEAKWTHPCFPCPWKHLTDKYKHTFEEKNGKRCRELRKITLQHKRWVCAFISSSYLFVLVSWSRLWSWGRLWTPDPLASTSKVLGLQIYASTSCLSVLLEHRLEYGHVRYQPTKGLKVAVWGKWLTRNKGSQRMGCSWILTYMVKWDIYVNII